MHIAPLILSAAVMAAMANATSTNGTFGLSFDWGDLELCTSGIPNLVPSPTFEVSNVPAGTARIRFELIDRDAPGYAHGGGTVDYSGRETIAAGAFAYKSPCPPNSPHTYEWRATALAADGRTALGHAMATSVYP